VAQPGTSAKNTTVPAVKNASATNASRSDSAASSRKIVLIPRSATPRGCCRALAGGKGDSIAPGFKYCRRRGIGYDDEEDARDAIRLLRLSYDRVVRRSQAPSS
jgi:hypothetical protein